MSRLSIGSISKATGIPVATLRTWERRYGFPKPVRTPGGHRTYHQGTIKRLLEIKQAIDSGQRASEVVSESAAMKFPVFNEQAEPQVSHAMQDLLNAIDHYDGGQLQKRLDHHWFTMGGVLCLDECIAPLVRELGQLWAQGKISVAQEHFASEGLRDFLTQQWRPLSARVKYRGTRQNHAPLSLCVTLPGENHTLGLHMVATTLALCGHEVLFLGADVPLDSIFSALHRHKDAYGLFVSISSYAKPLQTKRDLHQLNSFMGQSSCKLVLGGLGVPKAYQHKMIAGRFADLALEVSKPA